MTRLSLPLLCALLAPVGAELVEAFPAPRVRSAAPLRAPARAAPADAHAVPGARARERALSAACGGTAPDTAAADSTIAVGSLRETCGGQPYVSLPAWSSLKSSLGAALGGEPAQLVRAFAARLRVGILEGGASAAVVDSASLAGVRLIQLRLPGVNGPVWSLASAVEKPCLEEREGMFQGGGK